MRVLVVNAGSSSVKLRSLDQAGEQPNGAIDLPASAGVFDAGAVAAAIDQLGDVDAVGHRIVHGGSRLLAPTVVDDASAQELDDLVELAPLHQPPALAALRLARERLAHLPHVACFDTAFHATIPPAAHTYAVPRAWRDRWGVRRFGFHGLSHAWVARRAGGRRIVSCHLGSGASITAIVDGRSVDTTMGFTPLEGLVMASRAGTVDPGLLLWLLDGRLTLEELHDGLERTGGLHALAGTSDMGAVVERRAAGDHTAAAAFDVYVHAVVRHIGAMTASAGGLDTLVFTGGVGEHAPALRAAVADRLAHLGVAVDPDRNNGGTGSDHEITAPGASAATLVVTAREDLEIRDGVLAALVPPPDG